LSDLQSGAENWMSGAGSGTLAAKPERSGERVLENELSSDGAGIWPLACSIWSVCVNCLPVFLGPVDQAHPKAQAEIRTPIPLPAGLPSVSPNVKSNHRLPYVYNIIVIWNSGPRPIFVALTAAGAAIAAAHAYSTPIHRPQQSGIFNIIL